MPGAPGDPAPPPALALGEGEGPARTCPGPPAPTGDHAHVTLGAVLNLRGSQVPQQPHQPARCF